MQNPQNPYNPPPIPPVNDGGFTPTGGGGGQVNATLLLVLGILGIVCCQILAPVTWVMSNSAMATLNAGGGTDSDRSMVNIARILGIVGTVLLVLSFLYLILGGGLAAITAGRAAGAGAGVPPLPR